MSEPRFVLVATSLRWRKRMRLGLSAYARPEADHAVDVLRADGWEGIEVVSEREWAIEEAKRLVAHRERVVEEAQRHLEAAREQLAAVERTP